jgi:hypothetical protein
VQSVTVATTVRVGNHALTAAEQAAGVPDREPFVDPTGTPIDPSSVAIWLTAPTGQVRSFAYPTPGPTDEGAVAKETTGRYYVDWTPDTPEDGVWRWYLVGAMSLGAGQSDQDLFYVRRPIAGPGVVSPALARDVVRAVVALADAVPDPAPEPAPVPSGP